MGEPYLESPPRCIFCRALRGPFPSVELYSKWMRKAAGTDGAARLVIENGICKKCDRGWTSSLDKAARSLIEPATRGDRITMAADQQAALARWAVAKAWCLELGRRHDDTSGRADVPIPVGYFHWLNDQPAPPPGLRVWLGQVDTGSGARAAHYNAALTAPGANKPSGQFATFTVGQCVVQLSAYTAFRSVGGGKVVPADVPMMTPPTAIKPYLVDVWPSTEVRPAWPPAETVAPGDLEAFARWNGAIEG